MIDGGVSDASIVDVDAAGGEPVDGCVSLCEAVGISPTGCGAIDHGDAGRTIYCDRPRYYCAGGRRPAGFVDEELAGGSVVGRRLARMALLEGASVGAFLTLARELAAHRAPPALVVAAERAARDEVRHARTMQRLASRHGVTVNPLITDGEHHLRPLVDVARENAVEGTVRECWGALEAAFQAVAAEDLPLRRAMRSIARDEASHAELAFAIDRWAQTRLDNPAWSTVAKARREALHDRASTLANDHPDPTLTRLLGLPPRATSQRWFAEVAHTLWAA